MRMSSAIWSVRAAACMLSLACAGLCLAADEEKSLRTLIVSKDVQWRNPTTEIHVDFGDVRHLSPWRIKWRIPRGSGTRGGQLVTLRDAMLAINEEVARDDEMPEHTFAFAADGSLSSICDIPVSPSANGNQQRIVANFENVDGATLEAALSLQLLNTPVRDFAKVMFIRKTVENQSAADGTRQDNKVTLLKTGTTRTIALPGGAKMEMIWCGPGTFMMGSPSSEEGRFEDESQHKVTLTKGFWLGKFEVTQAQWASVMGSNPSRFKGDARPVETVSWSDCQIFINRLHAISGLAVRLPTEAEWEYACRAGSTGAVAGTGLLGEMAWYDMNSENQTHDVGINKPNAWGFYDMHGNVLEWCSDWFSKQEAPSVAKVDPKGPPTGSFRMMRGGCWFYFARDCRSAYRLKRDPDVRNSIYGFRIACSSL